MALYHQLDPLWRRAPRRFAHRLETIDVAGLTVFRMTRLRRGRPVLPVLAFLIGDTLVDTGIAGCADELAAIAGQRGVRRALLTHHHEDHVGGAAALAAQGVEVLASAATRALVARPLPIRLYQHLLWGPFAPVDCTPLGATLELDGERAEVLPAPGHAVDQVVFWLPARRWLFAGDCYAVEKVRVFREDEDFAASVATLERLAALDVEVLFCAHRPVERDGRGALRRKLEYLREVEREVRELDAAGLSRGEITRRLRGGRRHARYWVSFGDVSAANLVRSILAGPRPRREVVARLARLAAGASAPSAAR